MVKMIALIVVMKLDVVISILIINNYYFNLKLCLNYYFQAMPIILRSPVLNIRGIIGSTLVVTCTASGFPKPFINWRHNWGHVCAEPRCKIENFGNGTGTFTIYNIQASDAGAYSCEAINSKGRMFADNDAHVAIIDSGNKKLLVMIFNKMNLKHNMKYLLYSLNCLSIFKFTFFLDEPFTVCRCNGHSNECDQYGRCVVS
jgi:dystroglycan 1